MAVPDPHIDELDLMSYAPRTRGSKQGYLVPSRQDFIEVLWCLDHKPGVPQEWCVAEVLHTHGPPAQDYLAKGVILYTQTEYWDQQVSIVEFLPGYLIRCTAEQDGVNVEYEDADHKNPNPALSWRYCNRSISDEDENGGSDDEWIADHTRYHRGYQSTLNGSRTMENSMENCASDVKSLRAGHASLAVEVETMKRVLANQTQRLSRIETSSFDKASCTNVSCVLSRLRQKLALKLQSSPKNISTRGVKRCFTESEQTTMRPTGEGVQPGILRARVECTLRQFENLARKIKAESGCNNEIIFVPEFCQTQLPSPSSTEFRILFPSFAQLCDQISVSSLADRLEMARKCSTGQGGDILRVLGTYSFDEDDRKAAARIYVGTSCGVYQRHVVSELESCGAVQLYPVLTRDNREWNIIDSRYESGLHMERLKLPPLAEATSEMQAFALHWKRSPDIGSRTWSKSLCEPEEGYGYLDVSLPFVQTNGTNLCTELGGLASDEIWIELLSNR